MKMRFRHGWAWAMIWVSMNWLLVSHHSLFPTGKKLQSSQVRSIHQSVIHSSLLASFFIGIPPTPSQSRPPTKNKGLWMSFLPPLQPLIRIYIYMIYIYISIYLLSLGGSPFGGSLWSPMNDSSAGGSALSGRQPIHSCDGMYLRCNRLTRPHFSNYQVGGHIPPGNLT